MTQFNTYRHNTQYGGQYIHSHKMDHIRRIGFGHENNDSTRKFCSFLDFTPLAMSEVVNYIASFHVWKFWGRPWKLLKVSLNDAKSDLIYLGKTVRSQCILP